MKKLICALIICVVAVVMSQPVIEPIEPIEVKPVLVKSQYEFKHTGRFYQKVTMPDGSKQEIKSLVPLTPKQWEERAKNAYVKPLPEPEPCTRCGGSGIEP